MAWRVFSLGVVGLAVVTVGCGNRIPRVIVHQYSYQAVPPPAPGGVPVVPPGPPQPVPYQTVYPAAPTDDPTLVVFENISTRATVRLSIDGGSEIVLPPGRITANIHLDVGDHQVRVWRDVPTVLGARSMPEQLLAIRIEARGRWQYIQLSD